MKKIIILFLILFLSPLKLAAQNIVINDNKTPTAKPLNAKAEINVNKKDPKLITITQYKPIDKELYEKKLKDDEIKREEFRKDFDEEYFDLYLIFEKIIRANKLQYQNWRVGIKQETEDFNAFATAGNYVALHSSLYDTFFHDPDALAFVICHELAHLIYKHVNVRIKHNQIIADLKKQLYYGQFRMGDGAFLLVQAIYERELKRIAKVERELEFQADKEGLVLMARAGFDVEKSKDTFDFISQTGEDTSKTADHPTSAQRIANATNEIRMINLNNIKKQGEYNIYNSDVLPVRKSSDKKTLVISKPANQTVAKYTPQTPETKLLQSGYKYYLNNNYALAEKYFLEAFEENSSNYIPALYLSYIFEQRFKANKDKKNLSEAKNWAKKATNLNPTSIPAQKQFDDITKLIKESKN